MILHAAQHALTAPTPYPEISPAVREALHAIDTAEIAVLEDEDYLLSQQGKLRNGLAQTVGAVLTGTSAALVFGASPWAAPIVIGAFFVALCGAVTAGFAPSETREARQSLREKQDNVARLSRELESCCAQERKVNEQSMRRMSDTDAAVTLQVMSDPFVTVAAHRYQHALDVVNRNQDLLARPRDERLSACSPLVDEMRETESTHLGMRCLVGAGGTAFLGLVACSAAGSAMPILLGLAGAYGVFLVGAQRHDALVTPAVDRRLRHRLEREVGFQQPRLDALRQARDTTQKEAVDHYAALLRASSQAQPNDVRVEDTRVIIGGVPIPRSAARPQPS